MWRFVLTTFMRFFVPMTDQSVRQPFGFPVTASSVAKPGSPGRQEVSNGRAASIRYAFFRKPLVDPVNDGLRVERLRLAAFRLFDRGVSIQPPLYLPPLDPWHIRQGCGVIAMIVISLAPGP